MAGKIIVCGCSWITKFLFTGTYLEERMCNGGALRLESLLSAQNYPAQNYLCDINSDVKVFIPRETYHGEEYQLLGLKKHDNTSQAEEIRPPYDKENLVVIWDRIKICGEKVSLESLFDIADYFIWFCKTDMPSDDIVYLTVKNFIIIEN